MGNFLQSQNETQEEIMNSLKNLKSRQTKLHNLDIKNWEELYRQDETLGQGSYALNYLHNNPHLKILHRDIKPLNILVFKNNHIKLADFGESIFLKEKDQKINKSVGTLAYQAPEMNKQQEYDESVDIFSLGVTLHQLCHLGKENFILSQDNLPGQLLQNYQSNCLEKLIQTNQLFLKTYYFEPRYQATTTLALQNVDMVIIGGIFKNIFIYRQSDMTFFRVIETNKYCNAAIQLQIEGNQNRVFFGIVYFQQSAQNKTFTRN
eukprot:403340719